MSTPRDGAPSRTRLPDTAKWAIGTVAILAWGLVFDQLTRVAKWILDTSPSTFPPLADLHARYRNAHTILVHGDLYRYQHGAFTYPPVTGYLFVPFRAIGWPATAVTWTVANMVVLAALLAMVLWKWFGVAKADAWLASAAGLAPAMVFALFPFRSLLFWGQLGLFLLFVVFVDLFVVPRRFRGMLIGAATAVKLLPALFVIWLLARRDVPAVVRVGATFLVLTVLAALLWPHASAQYWFHILPSGKDVSMVSDPTHLSTAHGQWYDGVGKVDNQSIRGMLGRPPFRLPGTMPWALLALVTLVAGAYTTVRFLGQRRELAAFVVLSCTTVLISPVSWVHYSVFAGLAPFVALLEWRRDRVLAIASIVLTVAMCANLEDTRLSGPTFTSLPFENMSPVIVFAVRNLYVLGGLAFLGIATWRAWRTTDERGDHAPAAPSALTSATP